MSLLEALILGLVQGITEFLPVSSSGHLLLFQKLLGFKDLENYLLFDLVCHLGTLLAVGLIFYREIKEAFLDRTQFLQVVVGTLPLFPLVLLLKPIKSVFSEPQYLGYFFLVTALILFLGEHFSKARKEKAASFGDAFKIGCFQALAILPGISRSGSTISGARILGWDAKRAISFSFLLSIPAILGAITLEIYKLNSLSEGSFGENPLSIYIVGLLTSFVIGAISLKFLIRIAHQGRFKIFIWYCLALGILALFFIH